MAQPGPRAAMRQTGQPAGTVAAEQGASASQWVVADRRGGAIPTGQPPSVNSRLLTTASDLGLAISPGPQIQSKAAPAAARPGSPPPRPAAQLPAVATAPNPAFRFVADGAAGAEASLAPLPPSPSTGPSPGLPPGLPPGLQAAAEPASLASALATPAELPPSGLLQPGVAGSDVAGTDSAGPGAPMGFAELPASRGDEGLDALAGLAGSPVPQPAAAPESGPAPLSASLSVPASAAASFPESSPRSSFADAFAPGTDPSQELAPERQTAGSGGSVPQPAKPEAEAPALAPQASALAAAGEAGTRQPGPLPTDIDRLAAADSLRAGPPQQALAPLPSLAALIPAAPRGPIMATVDVPRPGGPLPVAANDSHGSGSAASDTAVGAAAVGAGAGPTGPLPTAPASAGLLPPAEAGNPGAAAQAAPARNLQQALVPADRSGSILGLGAGGGSVAKGGGQALALTQGGGVAVGLGTPEFTPQDELILELSVAGFDATDTVVAYDTRRGIYLPLGTLARILDLAIRISDEGRYAFGWVLREDRTVRVDLRQQEYAVNGVPSAMPDGFAIAYEGEMYLRAEDIARFIPVEIVTSLRAQSITIKTLEPFPFETRQARESQRNRLAQRGGLAKETWPREETPYRIASLPGADLQLRATSRTGDGEQLEGDVLLAGDLAMLSAQAFLSANSDDGLVTSLVELGRLDPDGQLLGPLKATEFAIGDVSNPTMPLGLRSVTGRGVTLTNAPLGSVSAFDKVDLRGVLQDGFEVELYRNDILIASTADRINGRYEFLQVPVDFGLNVFRLVFYGPQGQRYEEVQSISVGDGRVAAGDLVYRAGVVQKDQNLLGVRDPDFIRQRDFGDWRATAELSYGLSADLTTVMSASWFELDSRQQWNATGGIRTGLGRFAVKADLAVASGGAFAFSSGIGGRIGRSGFTATHIEYSGAFLDETRTVSREFLRRSTELDFNTTLGLGGEGGGLSVPLTARLRHFELRDGRKETNAQLRASTRLANVLASNTFEYTRNTSPIGSDFSRLIGNFDLATAGRSRTRARASLSYAILPQPDLVSASLELDHALDDRTTLRAGTSYVFDTNATLVSASAQRDFDRFSLALDGNYVFGSKSYAIGLRLGMSFGRDPLTGRFFTSRQSLAGSGSASLMAFHDRDGDGIYGPPDAPLPDIDFIAFNATARTDERGMARLVGLGAGRPVTVQVDTATLPDIDLAPARRGFEFVPRAGRTHSAEVAVVSLSEVEGTVVLVRDGTRREVSGVRLELRGSDGKPVAFARTEVDGYYFFERVAPGRYTIAVDEGQASRLGICLAGESGVAVGPASAVITRDLAVSACQ